MSDPFDSLAISKCLTSLFIEWLSLPDTEAFLQKEMHEIKEDFERPV
jgi:hypothetical protein